MHIQCGPGSKRMRQSHSDKQRCVLKTTRAHMLDSAAVRWGPDACLHTLSTAPSLACSAVMAGDRIKPELALCEQTNSENMI